MAINWRLVLTAGVHALVGTSSSYYTSALNQIEPHVVAFANRSVHAHYGWQLDEAALAWLWSTLAALVAVGAFVGAYAAKWPSERLGNRDTVMLVKNLLEIPCAVGQFLAPAFNSLELLLLGRFVSGVTVAMAMFIPVLLAECAPTSSRGVVATLAYVGMPFWNIVGTLVGMPQLLGTADRWPFVLLLPAAPALVHLACTPFVPRSPKFLYMRRRAPLHSRKAIAFYQGGGVDSAALFDAYDREAAFDADRRHHAHLRSIWRSRHLRWPLLVCVVANMATAFGGGDFVAQYSTGFLKLVGVPPDGAALVTVLVTQVPGLIVTLVGLALIERCGRRFLMLLGVGLGVLATGCVFVAALLDDGADAAAFFGTAGLFLSVIGYYVGPSFVAALLPGELCPQASRSYTAGVSFSLGWLPSVLIVVLYPPLQLAVGAFAFVPLVLLGTLSFIWLALYMPETRGRDVDEIVNAWRPSAKPHPSMPLRADAASPDYASTAPTVLAMPKDCRFAGTVRPPTRR